MNKYRVTVKLPGGALIEYTTRTRTSSGAMGGAERQYPNATSIHINRVEEV